MSGTPPFQKWNVVKFQIASDRTAGILSDAVLARLSRKQIEWTTNGFDPRRQKLTDSFRNRPLKSRIVGFKHRFTTADEFQFLRSFR